MCGVCACGVWCVVCVWCGGVWCVCGVCGVWCVCARDVCVRVVCVVCMVCVCARGV